MPLDNELATMFEELGDLGPAPESLTVADNRATVAAFAALGGEPTPVANTEDVSIPAGDHQIPARIYTPLNPIATPTPVTVSYHGGGWVTGDLDSQDQMARIASDRSGSIVVSVDYRLAPEHRFPASINDAYTALEWVAANATSFGGDASKLAVFGESAGGNIASVTVQEAKRRGGPAVTFQALAYPATDRFDDSPSMHENIAGPVLSRAWLEWFWGAYLNTPDEGADVRVSPARSEDLSGLPPAFILTAELDPLRDQGERYGELLRSAGVAAEVKRVPGAIHGFLSFTGKAQVSRDSLDEVGAALRDALS